MIAIAIGVHVHAEPERLRATLAALEAHTPSGFELLLLPDGPDPATSATLSGLSQIAQSATATSLGAAACFNRLAQETKADTLILLESGTIVAPGWLEKLLYALAADPRHGLACPSTNRAWNQLAAFPNRRGDDADIVSAAAEAERRFGSTWRSLAPLWDVGDFCLAVRRTVIDAVGAADEAYGQGPCWEMDYAIRAVRAGFIAVWAQGAYVYRHPFTERRQLEEMRRFEESRRRYQDKFCGLRLTGARTSYAHHCRGEACQHFAPPTAAPGALLPIPTPSIPLPLITKTAVPPPPKSVPQAPLVSCIMPTNGRPEWVAQAIHYFQRQDYANLELIIVDASPDHLVPPIPNDSRIRHHRISSRCTIGGMRNIACGMAQGEIILHWDDDDWYGANRITAQVQPILDGQADITGLTDTCFFEIDRWKFWRCTPELHRRMFWLDVHCGTLAFRRSLFGGACQYPDLSLAEDAAFLQRAVQQGARLTRLRAEGLFVYLRHTGNAWVFSCGAHIDARGWRSDMEPSVIAHDRAFYAARSRAMVRTVPRPLPPDLVKISGQIAIGVHVHAEPERLRATLAALEAHTPSGFELLLLPDGPDPATSATLSGLSQIAQSATVNSLGAAACFNRLAQGTKADTLILLESGTIVAPGWLDKLLAALAADPRHGLACPSTNRAWNQLAAFPSRHGDEAGIIRTAAEAERRFGSTWKSLAPLWDVGDFCLAVRRAAVDAVGPADEAYGQGPCWEMDYAIRAVRAGFIAVWAQGAYVFRHPFTERRQSEEARRFEESRRRYQDKFCGLLLSGARTSYAPHCRGEACQHFAPPTDAPNLRRTVDEPSVPLTSITETAIPQPLITPPTPKSVSSPPLVSCIMPTANRRRFVPGAIAQFLAQDYPASELVILDDGGDPMDDLIPSHRALHYLRMPRYRSLGVKRNAACEAARGEIILHWDDDDWYAPDRIRTQVDALRTSGADLCGLDRVLFFDAHAGMAWEYVYPPGGAPWVYGATLCYRREYWRAHPFPDISVGEDNFFAGAARRDQVCVLSDNRFFVALVHTSNTSPKNVRDPRWQPRDAATVRRLAGPYWPPPESSGIQPRISAESGLRLFRTEVLR